MLRLTISRDTLAGFREALCNDRPIDPGPGGWTLDKMMMLAGVLHLLPFSMDSKRHPELSYRAQTELDSPRVHEEHAEADFAIMGEDVIAATVCCRMATLEIERDYWEAKGHEANRVMQVGLRKDEWSVEVQPIAGMLTDTPSILGILPVTD